MTQGKKLASLLLALVLVLAAAVPALAAGNGAITIDNPQKDRIYTAYRIFDVVYNTDQSAYAYTIEEGSDWFGVVTKVENGEHVSAILGLKIEKAPGTAATYTVTEAEGFSAAAFANTLKASLSGKSGTVLTSSGAGVAATGLDLGYYFVSSNTGALCNLTTTNPTVTIHDKNDVPFDKTADKVSVEIGEDVHYTIKGKVPDTTGFSTYDYVITDKMSAGLTLDKGSIQIWISNDDQFNEAADGKLAEEYYQKTIEGAKDFNNAGAVDFRIDFKPIEMNKADLYGKYIFITYTAKVNASAIAKIERNNAILNYSNDPTDNTKHGTLTDEEKVYSAQIVIDKYAAEDTTKKLQGATFVLYKNVGEGTDAVKHYYHYDEAAEAVTWTTDKAEATSHITDENGAATFIGLKDGAYFLEETAAPAGYNLLNAPVEIAINGKNSEGTIVEAQLTHTEGVANSTGTQLPSTGGIGTTIFYAAGGALVLAAIVLLITRKRMKAEK